MAQATPNVLVFKALFNSLLARNSTISAMAMARCTVLMFMLAPIVAISSQTWTPTCRHSYLVGDQSLLQTTSRRFQVMTKRHEGEETQQACCSACAGKAYCSPGSGRCYDWKKKNYYTSCGVKPAAPSCCTDCAGKLGFFSPSSGSCYKSKSKDYYQACPAANSNAPKGECKVGGDKWCAATVPDANFSLMTCPHVGMRIKAITYNLFWWNLFGQRRGNGGSAGKLVKRAAGNEPFDLAGFQECDDPNWIMGDAGMSGDDYDYVRWGSNTLAFNKNRFEKLASGEDKFAQDFGRFNYKRGAHWARLQ